MNSSNDDLQSMSDRTFGSATTPCDAAPSSVRRGVRRRVSHPDMFHQVHLTYAGISRSQNCTHSTIAESLYLSPISQSDARVRAEKKKIDAACCVHQVTFSRPVTQAVRQRSSVGLDKTRSSPRLFSDELGVLVRSSYFPSNSNSSDPVKKPRAVWLNFDTI